MVGGIQTAETWLVNDKHYLSLKARITNQQILCLETFSLYYLSLSVWFLSS